MGNIFQKGCRTERSHVAKIYSYLDIGEGREGVGPIQIQIILGPFSDWIWIFCKEGGCLQSKTDEALFCLIKAVMSIFSCPEQL